VRYNSPITKAEEGSSHLLSGESEAIARLQCATRSRDQRLTKRERVLFIAKRQEGGRKEIEQLKFWVLRVRKIKKILHRRPGQSGEEEGKY